MSRAGRRRLLERAANLCLRCWPARAREREGRAVVAALVDQHEDEARSAWPYALWLGGECASIAGAGVRLRVRAVRRAAARSTGGWSGDLRFAARTLRRAPTFTLIAVSTLAIGIGANAAVFGIVERVLLRPPPYENPNELVLVWNTLGDDPARVRVAGPDVAVFRERATLFEGFAFVTPVRDFALDRGTADGAVHVRLATVTPDLFDLLGVVPALGRSFEPADAAGGGPDDAAAPTVALLSHEEWTSTFGADPAVLGIEVRLNGATATVIGVLPVDFRLELPPAAGIATDADVWAPIGVPLTAFQRTAGRRLDQDSDNTGVAVARLRRGVQLPAARAELARIGADLQRDIPAYAVADLRVDARPLQADATEHVRGLLGALLAGATLVLLVACLNVSTLVLARGLGRTQELSVRAALGAGRGRLLRQLATENALLVGLGALGASLLAAFGSGLLAALVPPELGAAARPGGEALALVFATFVAAVAVLGFGIGPAATTLARERAGRVGSRLVRDRDAGGGARRGLVLTEVALSVVLGVGAVFFLRAVGELRAVDPGFEAEGALTFQASLRVPGRYGGPADRARLVREIESGLAQLPGVRAAGVVGALPLAGRVWTQPYGFAGQAEHEWEANRADFRVVSSGYFEAMGIGLLEGRTFSREEDLVEEQRVVVVDEALARRVAPAGSAVGATVAFPLDGSAVEARIVGVVERVRHDDLAAAGREALYVPYRQEASRDLAFVVRAERDPEALAPAVRRILREIDSQIPVYALRTMRDYVDAEVAPTRFALVLLAAFAGLGLLAAALGLYGVVAFEVGRRTRDIGLRLAVGASASEIRRGVLLDGLRVGGAGVGLGLALAWAASRVLEPLLFGVSVREPMSWVVVALGVLATTVIASWVPAGRASRLDPTLALRADP